MILFLATIASAEESFESMMKEEKAPVVEKTIYNDICVNQPKQCDYSWDKDIPLLDRFPTNMLFNQNLFEKYI